MKTNFSKIKSGYIAIVRDQSGNTFEFVVESIVDGSFVVSSSNPKDMNRGSPHT